MSIRGRWRIVETPGWDMAVAGAYILFDEDGGQFAFHCLTGDIHSICHGDAAEFDWQGSDEMEPAHGDGWAQLQDDGFLKGEICLSNGDDIPLIARQTKLLQQPVRCLIPDFDGASFRSNGRMRYGPGSSRERH